jgi:hypothetical protein
MGSVLRCKYRRVGRAEYEKIAGDFVRQDGAGLPERTLQARATAFGLAP